LAFGNREDSGSVHLEDSTRARNERGSDEPHFQYHQPDETFTGESTIADRRLATPEDIASSDEMITMIERGLKGAQQADREAFILSGIEGFSLEEIAVITDRKPEQVKASIVAAREQLRKFPPLASQFRNKQLQNTGTNR
jgi:DNA-directed RNA polymerase specialized sigma24 family protein